MNLHGSELVGPNGKRFVIFDPPWWRIDAWLWWLWIRIVRPTQAKGCVTICLEGKTRQLRMVAHR